MSLGTLIPIVLFIGFIFFMIKKGKEDHGKLLKESRQIAPQIGFTLNENRIGYQEIPPDLLMRSLSKTPLGKGYGLQYVSIYNIFERKEDELMIYLFQYKHSTSSSSGHSFITHHMVACFISSKLKLPYFRLQQKLSFQKLINLVGIKNIYFSSHPQFSEINFLQGTNEDEIRAIFTESILSYFANNQKLTIEGMGDTFLFYHFNTKIEPKDLPSFYNQAKQVFSLFYR